MLSVETIRLHRVLHAPVTPMVTIKDKHGAMLIVNGTTINAQKKVIIWISHGLWSYNVVVQEDKDQQIFWSWFSLWSRSSLVIIAFFNLAWRSHYKITIFIHNFSSFVIKISKIKIKGQWLEKDNNWAIRVATRWHHKWGSDKSVVGLTDSAVRIWQLVGTIVHHRQNHWVV